MALKLLSAYALILSLFFGGVSVSENDRPLDDFCRANAFTFSYDAATTRYTLEKDGNKVVLAPGMALALVNGRAVRLDAPVSIRDGIVYVPAVLMTYYENAISAELEEPTLQDSDKQAEAFTIVLDPGHGPRWYGGISQDGLKEADLVLPVAQVVKHCLEEKGYRVFLTRSTNRHLDDSSRTADLNARVDFTYVHEGDLFVSIHANSTTPPNPAAVGVETFYYPGKPVGSCLPLGERAEMIAARDFDVSHYAGGEFRGGAVARKILCQTLLETSVARSRDLAGRIQNALVAATGDADRGVKCDHNLRVLRTQICPAALVEIGFLTNPPTAAAFKTKQYREKIAAAIAAGIDGFARGR